MTAESTTPKDRESHPRGIDFRNDSYRRAAEPERPEPTDVNADALRFRWLCEHPDWHFIEHLCREFVADSSQEFLTGLRRVIDARRSVELAPLDEHRPAIAASAPTGAGEPERPAPSPVAWLKPGTNLVVHRDLKSSTNRGEEFSSPLYAAAPLDARPRQSNVDLSQALRGRDEPPEGSR
jgi:hypothetical protein